MEPARRERILARTRHLIRQNLPAVEQWIDARRDLFDYVRPVAGAIAYLRYTFDMDSVELFDALRRECSVLVTPAGHFGATSGLRFGFGYDGPKTMAGLAQVDELIARRVCDHRAGEKPEIYPILNSRMTSGIEASLSGAMMCAPDTPGMSESCCRMSIQIDLPSDLGSAAVSSR